MNVIPLGTLRYVTVVVRDARISARNYAAFYGIDRWRVADLHPDRLSNATVRGRVPAPPPPLDLAGPVPIPGAYGFRSAIGSTADGSLTFQLVQPTSGLSTFEEFLVTRGEGVHSLFATVMDRADFESLARALAAENVPIAQSYRVGGADYVYFDMGRRLAHFFVQVVVPRSDDWEAAFPVDDEWDFTAERAGAGDLAPAANARGITHFGVVVDNLSERLPSFARLFGQPVWRGMKWRTAPGSLEDPTYNGAPVDHEYFTGRADIGVNPSGLPFGFEVIQPTFGPSHYKEDFLQVLGPGIHHVDVSVPMANWEQWERTIAWLGDAFDAPTCMSGWLRNHTALFQYQDTRKRLGYVTELVAPRPAGAAPSKRSQPDYWYDFSAVASAPITG